MKLQMSITIFGIVQNSIPISRPNIKESFSEFS